MYHGSRLLLKMLDVPVAKLRTHSYCELVKNCAIRAGKVRMDWAKMIGIMPAMFTSSGRVPFTGIDWRVPIRPPGCNGGTQTGHDPAEDYKRKALTADTVFRNRLAQPDGKLRPADHAQDRGKRR